MPLNTLLKPPCLRQPLPRLLLQRRLELRDIRAARIHLTPLEHDKPATPPQPLQELVLPLAVELGFQVDQLQWGDNPALQAQGLAGTYRFDGQDHRLTISNLALAQGRYTASAVLQARAPMALQATVDGTVTTPLPGRTEAFTAAAQVRADGTLATQAAQLNLEANLQPAGATPAPGTAPAAKAAPAARVPAPAPAAMRATAQDKTMSALVGINSSRIISLTFAIGALLFAIDHALNRGAGDANTIVVGADAGGRAGRAGGRRARRAPRSPP